MKRFFVVLLVLLAAVAMPGFTQESTLIDFSELLADWPPDNPRDSEATLLDYSNIAGASVSAEDRELMKTSLAVNNWDVELNSSARTVLRQGNTEVRQAVVREGASQFEGEGVMGIRVSFPTEPFNAWALVQPPFEIPAYADVDQIQPDGTMEVPQEEQGLGRKYENKGVVKNVGVLRTVSVNVYGLNYPHALSLILQDENNTTQEIFMGYLDFDGWRELTWENPNYVTEVRHRELRQFPLYPQLAPMRKLVGMRVYRDGAQVGGDFISYVKDVNITYDLATLTVERDIDDEAVWGLLQQREEARREAELRRLGNVQVLRFLEEQRMYPGPDNNNGDNANDEN